MNIMIGNIIYFVGCLLDFVFDLKFNDKAKILLCNCFTSSLSIVAFVFLGAYDGLIGCVVTLLRLITIYFKDKYHKKFTFLFVVFFALYLLVFLEYSGIQTIVLFLCSICSFIPKWISKNMQIIRLGNFSAIILAIVYNLMIYNYAAISIQIVSAMLVLVALAKWAVVIKKKKKTEYAIDYSYADTENSEPANDIPPKA